VLQSPRLVQFWSSSTKTSSPFVCDHSPRQLCNVRADVEGKIGVIGYGDVGSLAGVAFAKNWITGIKLLLGFFCPLCACTMTPKIYKYYNTVTKRYKRAYDELTAKSY